jgi:ATP-dependent DNA ligase
LFEAICERKLEGIVAKRVDGSYRPGERGWTKIRNRDYWRYALERESAINKRRRRVFVWPRFTLSVRIENGKHPLELGFAADKAT